jgi:hypothetical protein
MDSVAFPAELEDSAYLVAPRSVESGFVQYPAGE